MAILNGTEYIQNPDGSTEIKLSLICLREEIIPRFSELIGENIEIVRQNHEPNYSGYDYLTYMQTYRTSDGMSHLIPSRRPVYWPVEPKQIEMEKFE